MTQLDFRPRRRPAPSRRRPLKLILLVLVGALLFALGTAFGKALGDRPQPGGTETTIRTLEPLPQEPATP